MDKCPLSDFQTQAPPRAVSFLPCFLSFTQTAADPLRKTASSSSFQMTQSLCLSLNHGCALPEFFRWCDDNFLDLNVSKTKEIIIDFRKPSVNPKPSTIHGEKVQVVQTYEYLGTMFDLQLKFSENTDSIVK